MVDFGVVLNLRGFKKLVKHSNFVLVDLVFKLNSTDIE